MKVDPYNRKKSYDKWKSEGAGFEGISKKNGELIRNFVFDMEQGLNVNGSHTKGSRSYARLLSYRSKIKFWAVQFEKRYKKNLNQINRKQFHEVCKALKEGDIKKPNGKTYTHSADYIKSFKAFWHWLERVSKGKIEDITNLVDTPNSKPVWVYMNEKQYKSFANSCEYDYRVLLLFMLDTGMRVTEMKNVRVSNFSNDEEGNLLLTISDEVSKVIGRKIKIMITKDLVKEYIEKNKLKDDDLLFTKHVRIINKYFKRKAQKLFKDQKSKAGEYYNQFTLTDCRHNSACYWLPKYPNTQGMMYRFGWKVPEKIFYYSEFLGMADNITETNMISETDKNSMQKEIDSLKQKIEDINKFFNPAMEKAIQELKQEGYQGFKKRLKKG